MSIVGFVYIMTNRGRKTLYVGVTNNLCRRVLEHKNYNPDNTFTNQYNVEYCICFEEFPDFQMAIKREKEIKKWNRQKKEQLINKMNPEWKELVTEKGFLKKHTPTSLLVENILLEFQQQKTINNKDISPELKAPDSPSE